MIDYISNCKKCNKPITKQSKSGYCRSCSHIGNKSSEKTKEKIRLKKTEWWKNNFYKPSEETKNKMRSYWTKEKREEQRLRKIGLKSHRKGKTWIEEYGFERAEKMKENLSKLSPSSRPEVREKIRQVHLGVPRPDISKIMKKRIGVLANNWQGGLSLILYPRSFCFELKEKIRQRDKQACQICGKRENDEISSIKKKIICASH